MTVRHAALFFVIGACHSYSGADDGTKQSPVRVRCSIEFCPDDKPVCCALPPEGGVNGKDFSCRAAGQCAEGITVRCRDAVDCASGMTCCMLRTADGYLAGAECTSPEACAGNNSVLCDRQKPSCDAGEVCLPDQFNHTPQLDVCAKP